MKETQPPVWKILLILDLKLGKRHWQTDRQTHDTVVLSPAKIRLRVGSKATQTNCSEGLKIAASKSRERYWDRQQILETPELALEKGFHVWPLTFGIYWKQRSGEVIVTEWMLFQRSQTQTNNLWLAKPYPFVLNLSEQKVGYGGWTVVMGVHSRSDPHDNIPLFSDASHGRLAVLHCSCFRCVCTGARVCV